MQMLAPPDASPHTRNAGGAFCLDVQMADATPVAAASLSADGLGTPRDMAARASGPFETWCADLNIILQSEVLSPTVQSLLDSVPKAPAWLLLKASYLTVSNMFHNKILTK